MRTPGQSSRDVAASYLREHVLVDPRVQGTFLKEIELAAQIGVSRTPVREALLTLAAEGLVEMVPQRGAWIPPLSARDISELLELRLVLECHAARSMIRTNSAPVDELRRIVAEQDALRVDGDPDIAVEFIRLDTLLHQTVIDAAHNTLMSATYSNLRVRQMRVGVSAMVGNRMRQDAIHTEHGAIVEAIAAGDADAACVAMTAHLDATGVSLYRPH